MQITLRNRPQAEQGCGLYPQQGGVGLGQLASGVPLPSTVHGRNVAEKVLVRFEESPEE